ncbi:MAG TPA: hypothetical protein VMF67_10235 [Rhizomicrobium sp.]|nr:hypothetical protein [Rhizomicrobium sp.]
MDGAIYAANAYRILGLDYEPECVYDANSVQSGCQDIADQSVTYRKVAGQICRRLDTPAGITDGTLIYASYSRGYKAGGFNRGIEPCLTVPVTSPRGFTPMPSRKTRAPTGSAQEYTFAETG